MRNTPDLKTGGARAEVVEETEGQHAVPYDAKRFFASAYRATIRGEPTDRNTIGMVPDHFSRFHYNAVENSIIRVMSSTLETPPQESVVDAWRGLMRRQNRRLLDVGSGTGHWIDFFRETFFVAEAVSLELADQMVDFLRTKYAKEAVVVLNADVSADPLSLEAIGGPVDYISAIGVMFHIVEDARWEAALRNLAAVLKPDGLLFVGGDFGTETKDVQFHRIDEFQTWREHSGVAAPATRINKRVRSLAHWSKVVADQNLVVVDLVRTDSDPRIWTPENDLLVLKKRA